MPAEYITLLGEKENTAYTSGNSIFSSDLGLTAGVHRNGKIRVTVAHSVAAIPYFRLVGAATTNLSLNSNNAMVADTLYTFEIPFRPKAGSQTLTFNVRLSATGTIRYLLVEHIGVEG